MRFRLPNARLAFLAITLSLLAACGRDVAFTLKYRDTLGISAGSPVMHDSMKIGEVTAVDVDPSGHSGSVAVRIDAKYRDDVYREAAFTIVRRDLLGPATGKRSIVMEDRGEARTAIRDGEVIDGVEQTIDPALRGITNAIDAAHAAVDESMKRRADEKSPDME